MFTLLSSIAGSALAQTEQAANSPSTMGLGILAALCAVAAFALLSRSKKLDEQIVSLTAQLDENKSLLKTSTSREKKLEKDLSEKSQNVTQLKKDMGAQRKKTHSTQEELKTLRNTHKTEIEKLKKVSLGKPAFEVAKPEAKKPEAAQAAQAAQAAPAKTEAVQEVQADPSQQQLDRIKQLEEQKGKLETKLAENKKYISKVKAEVKDSRYRVERYRRVDIMTKNKTGVIEDKLLTLGRQYYDAISEIALLKGDVKPPRPRTLVEAESRAVEREAEDKALESEAAAAELEKAEEAKNAPVQLDASHFEVEEEEEEAAEETSTDSEEAIVEPAALEATSEAVEAAPASV